MNTILTILWIWIALCVLAIGLITLRKDGYIVMADIESYFQNKRLILKVFSLFMLFAILPLSIPYSIAHFIRRR
jgi:F0F1-type ATP synthase membrane subunit c/vacuolar-type H+-ATPase subunit K